MLALFIIPGLAKDESSLRDLKVIKGAKIMVVGSTMNDVLSVNAPNLKEIQEEAKAASSKEPLSQQKVCLVISLDVDMISRLFGIF